MFFISHSVLHDSRNLPQRGEKKVKILKLSSTFLRLVSPHTNEVSLRMTFLQSPKKNYGVFRKVFLLIMASPLPNTNLVANI